MMSDNLLKEAIADAKAMKEIAIESAKLQVEEQYREAMETKVSDYLRESAEEGYPKKQSDVEGEFEVKPGEEVSEQQKLDSSEVGANSPKGVNLEPVKPKEPSASASDSSKIDNPGQEVEAFGDGKAIKESGDGQFAMDATDNMAGREGEHDQPAAGMDGAADLDGLDADLEAIIRELEAESGQGGGDEFGGDDLGLDVADEVPQEPSLEGFDDVKAGQEVDGPVKVRREENAVVTDKRVDGVANGKEVKPGESVTSEELDEEYDINEILREMEADDTSVDEVAHIVAENAALKESLTKHRDVIKFLQGRINEQTLMNAKLLYTSKLFSGKKLTQEEIKMTVSQFDKAANLREVKLVYNALRTKPANTRTSTKITEGFASTATGGNTKPKSAQVIEESITADASDEVVSVDRWKTLAGIKPVKK